MTTKKTTAITKSNTKVSATLITTAHRIAAATEGAYNHPAYATGEWEKAALLLLTAGFDAEQTSAIMMSKWMRWAADCSNKPYGAATAADLATFLDDPKNRLSARDVAEMVKAAR